MSKQQLNKKAGKNIEKLNAIYQAIPLPTYTWQVLNNDFELIDFNKAALFAEGDKLTDSLPIKASSYYKKEPSVLENFKKCLKNKSSFKQTSISKGNGTKLSRSFIYTYIQPDTLLIQTEEIKNHSETRDNIAKQLRFIENSFTAIAMLDTEMCYISVSNKWIEDYKLAGQQILGKSHYEIFPEISQEWKDIHQECLKGKTQKKEEDYFKRLDGTIDWVRWEIRPWYSNSRKIGGIIMLTENITERKRAEEKLILQNEELLKAQNKISENESRLIEAQKSAKIGSWETDLATSNIIWSEETYNIFELEPQSFNPTHKSFLTFVHPDDKANVDKLFIDSINKDGYHSVEHRILTFKGNLKHIEERWKVKKNRKGEPERLFGTCQDITFRKKLEQEREKIVLDLVQRNRDLEQFSFIVSHNLRAPVANIIGISDLIENSKLFSEDKELALGLSESVHNLDNIVKDLNKILQLKKEINEKKVLIKLSETLNKIKESIANLIIKENVKFVMDFSQKDEFFTAKSYVYSIFYNLISNSIKYKHPERNPVIEIKSSINENGFEINYSDNGIGIDLEKNEKHIFGLYKRFHTHIEGKGIGLFMVKNQVETLGGKISISSKINHGTAFKIEFKN
ncbi:PAS domain S-box protein [Bacteroidota bacterium]